MYNGCEFISISKLIISYASPAFESQMRACTLDWLKSDVDIMP